MASKNQRRTAPALVVTETRPAAVRKPAAVTVVKPLDFSRPLLLESFSGGIEWFLPDPSKPNLVALSANLWRGTGDSTEDVVSQAVPCYQVRIDLQVGGTVDTTFQQIAVPMHGGLKALSQIFLALHERAEQMNLASLGWDREIDEERQPA